MGGCSNLEIIESIEKLSLNAVQVDQSMTWENVLAELPGPLYGHCSVVYNGQLIVIGGRDSRKCAYSDSITEISLAPPYTNKLLGTMPQTRCRHGVAIFDDKIAILGGRVNSVCSTNLASVLLYDIAKNECKAELAALPYPVSEMATVKWGDDNVIILGGTDSNSQLLNKVLLYNIKTQKSHMLPDMKYKRGGCVAAVVRDTVIVMGGEGEGGKYLKSVECFRFDRYTWQELPEMQEERYRATAIVC
jgi:N-acetylneuraminic acid mutarotase